MSAGSVQASANDVQSVLRRAHEILRNSPLVTSNSKPQNPIQFYSANTRPSTSSLTSSTSSLQAATNHLSIGTNYFTSLKETNLGGMSSQAQSFNLHETPFKDSNDIMLIKKEAAKNYSNMEQTEAHHEQASSVATTTTKPKTKLNLAQIQSKLMSRTNSNASLNLTDENSDPISKHLLEHLKEENELLSIKVNKLRYYFNSSPKIEYQSDFRRTYVPNMNRIAEKIQIIKKLILFLLVRLIAQ